MDLVRFVDTDGALQEHRQAISGYVFVVDGGAVSWSLKKQELVTLSTTEANMWLQPTPPRMQCGCTA